MLVYFLVACAIIVAIAINPKLFWGLLAIVAVILVLSVF